MAIIGVQELNKIPLVLLPVDDLISVKFSDKTRQFLSDISFQDENLILLDYVFYEKSTITKKQKLRQRVTQIEYGISILIDIKKIEQDPFSEVLDNFTYFFLLEYNIETNRYQIILEPLKIESLEEVSVQQSDKVRLNFSSDVPSKEKEKEIIISL